MEVLGTPDKHIVDRSSRRKLFFGESLQPRFGISSSSRSFSDSTGAPRPVVDSKGRRRRPGAKSLTSVLKCDDELFIDFIAKCLTWDPDRRLKASYPSVTLLVILADESSFGSLVQLSDIPSVHAVELFPQLPYLLGLPAQAAEPYSARAASPLHDDSRRKAPRAFMPPLHPHMPHHPYLPLHLYNVLGRPPLLPVAGSEPPSLRIACTQSKPLYHQRVYFEVP